MGIFYTFSPKLTKVQLDEFLNDTDMEFDLYNEDQRMVVELRNLTNVDYLLFYYENENSLVAHSSHDRAVIEILKALKIKFNLTVNSDNDEFEVM